MSNEGSSNYDHGLYNLSKLDNIYIFKFLGDEPVKIPPMTMTDLNHILSSKMKPGKACDIYQLTVEHLRHCGSEAKLHILAFINRSLSDIYYLTCPEIKPGLGTAAYKGREKLIDKANSYRRIKDHRSYCCNTERRMSTPGHRLSTNMI